MSLDLIRALTAHAIAVSIPAGAIVLRSGEPLSNLYLLHRGRVALVWSGPYQGFPIEVSGPDQIIGLPVSLNGSCLMTACTLDSCEMGLLPAVRLQQLLEGNSSLWATLMGFIGSETARMRSMAGQCRGVARYWGSQRN